MTRRSTTRLSSRSSAGSHASTPCSSLRRRRAAGSRFTNRRLGHEGWGITPGLGGHESQRVSQSSGVTRDRRRSRERPSTGTLKALIACQA
jgi:hypothetical protein